MGEQDVPLFEAVYHDYAIGCGRVPGKWYGPHVTGYADPSGESDLVELTSNLGMCFTTGKQLGWVRQDFLTFSPTGAAFVRKLARVAQAAKPYLLFGRYVRPVRITSPVGRLIVGQAHLKFATIRVPAVLSFPGAAPEGERRDQAIMNADFYPTILEACGVPLPQDRKIDGKSLWPIVRSATAPAPREIMHWQWQKGWAVREGDWKLIFNAKDTTNGWNVTTIKGPFLANLSEDPGEGTNLVDRHPEVVARLTRLHERWKTDVEAN